MKIPFVDSIRKAFGRDVDGGIVKGAAAGTVLPTPPTPKVGNKQITVSSMMRTVKPNPKTALINTDSRIANTDLTTLRQSASTRETVRQFVKASPDLSASVTSYIRTAITDGYTAVAKNPDGSFNVEATGALAQVLTRMNILNDYSLGFDGAPSLRALCETWGLEMLRTGAMAGELVLNKARLPDRIVPVAVSQIQLYPTADARGVTPKQVLAGQEIDLNVPTFFMVTLDQDPLDAYPTSPLEPALQGVLFSAEFMNDLRRIVRRAIHPRVKVTIDEEKFMAMAPPEAKQDMDTLITYRNSIVASISEQINGLEPEDALVVLDSVGVEVLDHGNTNLSNEYKVIQEMIDSKQRAGAKVLPTVLGHSSATSNTASAETLMFLKYVEGALWGKFNEMLSKILTLAVRLLGHDVVVEFAFNNIDLRPSGELEAFRAMRQSRFLELLSLGMISDEEACVALTGHLPPPGYKPLSGTGFRPATAVQPAGDGYNGATNSGSTMNQNLKPETPTNGGRGSNKKAEVIPLGSVK